MTNLRQRWEAWADTSHFDLAGEVLPSDVVMRLSRALHHVMHMSRGARVIDIGCGDGHLIHVLERNGFRDVVGVEYSLNRLEYARRCHVSRARLVNCDALHLPFRDRAFDAAIAVGVIEHVADQEQFIAELSRITKNGGQVIIVTDCFFYRIDKFLGTYKSGFPVDFPPFPPTLFRQLKRYGLTVKGFEAWGVPWQHVRMALNRGLAAARWACRTTTGIRLSPLQLDVSYSCGRRSVTELPIAAAPRAQSRFLSFAELFYKGESLFVAEKP